MIITILILHSEIWCCISLEFCKNMRFRQKYDIKLKTVNLNLVKLQRIALKCSLPNVAKHHHYPCKLMQKSENLFTASTNKLTRLSSLLHLMTKSIATCFCYARITICITLSLDGNQILLPTQFKKLSPNESAADRVSDANAKGNVQQVK